MCVCEHVYVCMCMCASAEVCQGFEQRAVEKPRDCRVHLVQAMVLRLHQLAVDLADAFGWLGVGQSKG